MAPYTTNPPAARAAKALAAVALAALAATLLAMAWAAPEAQSQRGWQTVSAQQLAAGARRTHDHLEVQGVALKARTVRRESQQTRNGQVVSGSTRVSYVVPIVPEGWTRSQPVRAFVQTEPSPDNLVAVNLVEAPSYRGRVVELPERVRNEFTAMQVTAAADAFVLDPTPDPPDGDFRDVGLVMGTAYGALAALVALALVVSALRRSAPESTLARSLRRAALSDVGGVLGGALVLSALPLTLLGNDPGPFSWLVIGVSGLIVGYLAYLSVADLRRPVSQSLAAVMLCNDLNMRFEDIEAALDRELGPTPLAKLDCRVLPSFLCVASAGGLRLLRYDVVAQVYKQSSPTSTTLALTCVGYVTKGAGREAFLYTVTHPSTAPEVDRLVAAVAARAPWAIQGWQLSLTPAEVLRRYEQNRATYRGPPAA